MFSGNNIVICQKKNIVNKKFDSQKFCNRKYIVFVLRASIVDRITDYHIRE